MAITQNTYTGNGSTTNYSFTFPYLETTDIKVSVNGVATTAFTLANATTVSFNTAPANGAAIRIYRETDDSTLSATFYPGSAIRSNDLNENFTQSLYVAQETKNTVLGALLPNNSVQTSMIQDAAVTSAKLGSDLTIDHASGTATAPSITFDSNTGIYSPGEDQLAISTGGTGRVFVDASGRVGVGGSPLTALHLGGSSSQTIRINSNTSAGFVGTTGYITQIAANRNPIDGSIVNTGTATAFINLEADVSNGNIQFCTTGANNAAALERLRITSAGLVGIGTSSPGARLESYTAGTVNLRLNGSLVGGNTVDFYNFIPAVANDGFAIQLGGTTRAVIDSSGRVGIGTTSPLNKFVVSNGGAAGLEMAPDGFSGNPVIVSYNRSGAAYTQLTLDGASNVFAISGSERARIDSSGRLLVNTSSSPSAGDGQYARLVVQGSVGGDSAYAAFARNAAATAITANQGIGLLNFTDNAGNTFSRIECYADANAGSGDYPGRLVFATTADGASSPTERMRITNAGNLNVFSGDVIYARSSASSGLGNYFYSGWHSATGTTNGTLSFAVYTNGNVQNTNNSYGAISDIKLKENIVDASSQWDDIKALQVRKYNFKEGQTHTQIGLIAQEVELVSPGLVTESPDRDAEGNDLGTVTKSVNYSVLYMKAVKALQEAMERIEQLEAKVAALESA